MIAWIHSPRFEANGDRRRPSQASILPPVDMSARFLPALREASKRQLIRVRSQIQAISWE
jgi:hypothetical protein